MPPPATAEGPVLLTGFEPFAGRRVNASWAAVHEVAQAWTGTIPLVTARLPVSFEQAPRVLLRLLADVRPRLVVCVGEAAGRSAVGIERVAVNLADAPIPDAAGAEPRDVALVEHGPVAYFARLPVSACLAAARRTGVPTEASLTAGTYVCNATFYALMAAVADLPDVAAGFVHVPVSPQGAPDGAASLDTEASARALHAVLRAALAGPDDPAAAEHRPVEGGSSTGTLS